MSSELSGWPCFFIFFCTWCAEQSHSNQLGLFFYLLFGVNQAWMSKVRKHMFNLKTFDKSKSFPGLPWSALEQQSRVLQHSSVQKEPSALQLWLCRHADQLTSISDLLRDDLLFGWPEGLAKTQAKLHVFKLLETSDANADATAVCTHTVQVRACNPISPSFIFYPPTYYAFFFLYSISPPPDASMWSFYISHELRNIYSSNSFLATCSVRKSIRCCTGLSLQYVPHPFNHFT